MYQPSLTPRSGGHQEPGLRGIRVGSARELFVHRVDYRRGEAVVSVGATSLLRTVTKQPDAEFAGEVFGSNKSTTF
jgi:hypothetical protein